MQFELDYQNNLTYIGKSSDQWSWKHMTCFMYWGHHLLHLQLTITIFCYMMLKATLKD